MLLPRKAVAAVTVVAAVTAGTAGYLASQHVEAQAATAAPTPGPVVTVTAAPVPPTSAGPLTPCDGDAVAPWTADTRLAPVTVEDLTVTYSGDQESSLTTDQMDVLVPVMAAALRTPAAQAADTSLGRWIDVDLASCDRLSVLAPAAPAGYQYTEDLRGTPVRVTDVTRAGVADTSRIHATLVARFPIRPVEDADESDAQYRLVVTREVSAHVAGTRIQDVATVTHATVEEVAWPPGIEGSTGGAGAVPRPAFGGTVGGTGSLGRQGSSPTSTTGSGGMTG